MQRNVEGEREGRKMKLKGSCHCRAVEFECESKHPYPYQLCYCCICRKTQGGGGYAINLAADANTLKVKGEENISIYNAKMYDEKSANVEVSSARRRFCKKCGSGLWLDDPRWADLIHPFASAVDSELPVPPQRTHLMLASKASWVEPVFGSKDLKFDEYPQQSIVDWHQSLHLER